MSTAGVPIQPRESRGYFMLPQAPNKQGITYMEPCTMFPEQAPRRSLPTLICSA